MRLVVPASSPLFHPPAPCHSRLPSSSGSSPHRHRLRRRSPPGSRRSTPRCSAEGCRGAGSRSSSAARAAERRHSPGPSWRPRSPRRTGWPGSTPRAPWTHGTGCTWAPRKGCGPSGRATPRALPGAPTSCCAAAPLPSWCSMVRPPSPRRRPSGSHGSRGNPTPPSSCSATAPARRPSSAVRCGCSSSDEQCGRADRARSTRLACGSRREERFERWR